MKRKRIEKIDPSLLNKLILEYNAKRLANPLYEMDNALAICCNTIIHKTLQSNYFISYTDDWKADMIDRAWIYIIKYLHNYDPEKLKNGKHSDPYYYIANIVTSAFRQEIKFKHKREDVWFQLEDANSKLFEQLKANDNNYNIKLQESRKKIITMLNNCFNKKQLADFMRLITKSKCRMKNIDKQNIEIYRQKFKDYYTKNETLFPIILNSYQLKCPELEQEY